MLNEGRTGELNMTVITVIAIAAIGGFFVFLPQILHIKVIGTSQNCPAGYQTINGTCKKY